MSLRSSVSLLVAGAVVGFIAGRLTATVQREIIVQEPEIVWRVVAPEKTATAAPTPKISIHKPTPKKTATPAPTATATATPLPPADASGADLVLPASQETPALVRVKQLVGEAAVRVEFAGEIPRYHVFRVRNPNRLYVDFENTHVPGGEAGPRAGAAPIRELRARAMTSTEGKVIARVEVLLDEETGALPEVFREADGESVVLRW